MTPQEYQDLLMTTAEQILPLLPAHAAARLDEIMVDAIASEWHPVKTSALGVSLVIAYATYIDKSYPCSWTISPKQGVLNA